MVINKTYLSVSLRLELRSRNSVSSAARYVFNSFSSRARDFTTFMLHDLTDLNVERATAPHYINNHLCFHWPILK